MIPFVLETVVENVKPCRKMTIEKVDLNPHPEDSAFSKPPLPGIIPVMGFRKSPTPGQAGAGVTK
jgi:hypothetical protein